MFSSTVTFGFESEWATNIQPLLSNLYHNDLIPDPELHSYHCDCEHCADMEDYPLKAQRDSSCAGELISTVYSFGTYNRVSDLFTSIEHAAYETDAEPGILAGFHVHARHSVLHMRTDSPSLSTFRTFIATNLMLPALISLGVGRHLEFGYNNSNTLETLDVARGTMTTSHNTRDWLLDWYDRFNAVEEFENDDQYNTWRYITTTDRHGYINWRTRYDTIEFRLFRSTRMAWRMELYALLAMLTVSPLFHDALITHVRDTLDEDTWRAGQWLPDVLHYAPSTDDANGEAKRRLTDTLRTLCVTQYDYVNNTLDVPSTYVS